LGERGLSADLVEKQIVSTVDPGALATTGRIPFAPAAKKTLELSLRETLALRDRRIESKHLLLALLRERKGVAAQLLARHGVDRGHLLAALESREPDVGE
jgi:ATP-dependent Clp protease ATP-binding subunit ClpC